MKSKPVLSAQARAESVLSFAFKGLHNVPGKVQFNGGNASTEVCIRAAGESFGTWDGDELTRLVVGAHHWAMRVCLKGNGGPGRIRITLWPRKRLDACIGPNAWPKVEGHPTLDEALAGMLSLRS